MPAAAPSPDTMHNRSLRLNQATIDRIAAVSRALAAQSDGEEPSESATLRRCILRGLASLEAELGITEQPKAPKTRTK
jgi:hypothetical protein